MRTALVTGGCGFIGSNLVDFLKKMKYKVVVIDDLSSGKKEYCREDTEYIFDDFRKVLLTDLETKIDVIFHLAAEARIQPSFENPLYTCKNNGYGTAVVCEYARRNKCKIVYAGSSSFYAGVYLNPYAFTKWQGEEACKMYSEVYGVNIAIARFFNVYGPRNPLIGQYTPVVAIFEEQWKNNGPLTIIGDGEQRRDFTHVYDIIEAMELMSRDEWHSEIFNLGTGTNYSINELADMFGISKKHLPARRGEARETLADISKTKSCLGWQPKNSLPDYVSSLVGR
jgi:UDP-glucose 4-epimerase